MLEYPHFSKPTFSVFSQARNQAAGTKQWDWLPLLQPEVSLRHYFSLTYRSTQPESNRKYASKDRIYAETIKTHTAIALLRDQSPSWSILSPSTHHSLNLYSFATNTHLTREPRKADSRRLEHIQLNFPIIGRCIWKGSQGVHNLYTNATLTGLIEERLSQTSNTRLIYRRADHASAPFDKFSISNPRIHKTTG